MLYCFIREELEHLRDNDPMLIQFRYAKRLGSACLYNQKKEEITDAAGMFIDVSKQEILLRTSYPYMYEGIRGIQQAGGSPVENESDIRQIENWVDLQISKRRIVSFCYDELYQEEIPEKIEKILRESNWVFVKTRKKGFTAKISTNRLLQKDKEIKLFFEMHCPKEDVLFMSEWLDMKRDSLGKKESRHVIWNGKVMNSSRAVHSIRHTVPQSERYAAEKMAEEISKIKGFPKNYILDIGEVLKDEKLVPDVVELNPITPAMCYVNNSIFTERLPEVMHIYRELGMGAEYCLDAMEHRERYAKIKKVGETYTYISDNTFCFL